VSYLSFPGQARSGPAAALLIAGQSNAITATLDPDYVQKFLIIRHAQAGTVIAQWQEGQAIGDGAERAVAFAGRGLPLYLLWVHGEGDSSTLELATAYEASFTTWIEKKELDLAIVHSFIVGINAGFTAYPFRATTRLGQAAVAAALPSKRTLVDPDSVTAHDNNHYTFTGYQQLGALCTTAMRAIVP